jgi:hypothetical protein
LEKITIEKLENISSVFQNGLAFLGRIGKASLTVFPDIYAPLQPLVTLLYDVNVSNEKINIF